jgi:prephenate dehydrogenase
MKIAVLGAGHMGRWLVSELAKDNEVCVYDTAGARAAGLPLVKALPGLAGLKAFQPDILINAVSLQNTVAAFESAVPHLPSWCLLCDVASVKGEIPAYYRDAGFRFASVHPMFGPTFANVQQLKDENVIIISESDPQGVRFFRDFFARLGLRITEFSFAEHDRMIAYSLALPFASTMVFAACMERATVPGTTFKKHLEIARGLLSEDDYLLGEIIFGPHSLEQLDKVTSRLEFLKHVIRGRDFEEARAFFAKLRENVR